jgi:hypothetical protein
MPTPWVVETPESVAAPTVRIKSTQHKHKQQFDHAALNPLTFVASEQAIICTSCKLAVPFQNLDTHLRVAHTGPQRYASEHWPLPPLRSHCPHVIHHTPQREEQVSIQSPHSSDTAHKVRTAATPGAV